MKPRHHHRCLEQGSAILLVLVLTACSLLILGSTLAWTTSSTNYSQRNNEYFRTIGVAEASTEKTLSAIASDYQKYGDATVRNNVSSYRTRVPTSSENSLFSQYAFSNGQGVNGQNYVEVIGPQEFRVLSAQYRGLRGYASTVRIISNARQTTGSRFSIPAAVRQDVEVATIPLFQFAIFYNLDLEINPGPVMTVTGPVHANHNIYLQPQATLTFNDEVTSAKDIINSKKPGDPTSRTAGSIVFNDEHDGGTSTLNLPIGTDNSVTNVQKVIDPAPTGEDPNSDLGKQRYHNKAGMVVTVTGSVGTNGTIAVTSGLVNNFGTTIPQAQWNQFIKQPAFYNKREGKTVHAVEIDVAALRTWNATNGTLRPLLSGSGGDVTIIYVVDKRTFTSSTEPGVRMKNGSRLPDQGLTVATPSPIYVQGHYNITDATGTSSGTDTTHTKPASLVGDAVTVLSTAWNDANATAALSSRPAANTTVNAAFLAGIVETGSSQYSGGVENFPRFLETWSGDTFTYNGSMVVLFPSRIATGLWQGTGGTIGIYDPPTREWAFDTNFRNPAKLPPGTPSVRGVIRGTWHMIKPGTTNVVSGA